MGLKLELRIIINYLLKVNTSISNIKYVAYSNGISLSVSVLREPLLSP